MTRQRFRWVLVALCAWVGCQEGTSATPGVPPDVKAIVFLQRAARNEGMGNVFRVFPMLWHQLTADLDLGFAVHFFEVLLKLADYFFLYRPLAFHASTPGLLACPLVLRPKRR